MQDDVSFTSASAQSRENRSFARFACATCPVSLKAADRSKSDHPLFGKRFNSARYTVTASAGRTAARSAGTTLPRLPLLSIAIALPGRTP